MFGESMGFVKNGCDVDVVIAWPSSFRRADSILTLACNPFDQTSALGENFVSSKVTGLGLGIDG